MGIFRNFGTRGDCESAQPKPTSDDLYRPAWLRVLDFGSIHQTLSPTEFSSASNDSLNSDNHNSGNHNSDCADCGVPWCSSAVFPGMAELNGQGPLLPVLNKPSNGCPVPRDVPRFIEAYRRGDFVGGFRIAEEKATLTGLTAYGCHHPCEESCTYAMPSWDSPVMIRAIERWGFEQVRGLVAESGYDKITRRYRNSSGKRVVVIGAGPGGLQAAMMANRAGHETIVFDAEQTVGGFAKYLVPHYHVPPGILEFYREMLEYEGVQFELGAHVGREIAWKELQDADLLVLAIGASKRRNLGVWGADLQNVIHAHEFLRSQNRYLLGETEFDQRSVVEGKSVLIVGSGYTGDDCATTCMRLGALKIIIIQRSAIPPTDRADNNPWPQWPVVESKFLPYAREECGDRLEVLPEHALLELRGGKAVAGAQLAAIESFDRATGQMSLGAKRYVEVGLVLNATGFGVESLPGLKLQRDPSGRHIRTRNIVPVGDFGCGSGFFINALAHSMHAMNEALDSLAHNRLGQAPKRPAVLR